MEVEIKFLNVGNGDTIMLEWQDEVQQPCKFAMIDCNLVNGKIEEIIRQIHQRQIKEFEFVLMSHPHMDHFSGFAQFFDYCGQNDVLIRQFLHTCNFDPNYLATLKVEKPRDRGFEELICSPVNRYSDKVELLDVFKRLAYETQRKEGGFIKKVNAIGLLPLKLGHDLRMNFLSPGMFEVEKYVRRNYMAIGDSGISSKSVNNADANLLSTLTQIYSEDGHWQIILCSDVTKESFKRIMEDDALLEQMRSRKTIAVQIPSHGSRRSHYAAFWDRLALDDACAFVSGGSKFYGNSIEVLDYFKERCKAVYWNNSVEGPKDPNEGIIIGHESALQAVFEMLGETTAGSERSSLNNRYQGFRIRSENGNSHVSIL